ncbi:histidine phosphatase superfamily [Gautieria morchelliformis]|nr:histidine phosphatase superfamily [Gautieria morchelliformis]
MSRPVPRLFIIRHGETEWSLNGRHTGRTDIPLTPRGREIIKSHAKAITSDRQMIDPKNLAFVFVSPRQRAHETFHLLFSHLSNPPPHTVTEEVREWDYGDYEGITSAEIFKTRSDWDIFRDGCPGGESPEEMTNRVDRVIAKVHEIHRQFKEEGIGARDVLIVAHSHFTRAVIARWLKAPLVLGSHFNVEAAGVALLSYNHNSLNEPCLNGLNLYAF